MLIIKKHKKYKKLKKHIKQFIRHTFVAGSHNSFRPHFSRYYGLVIFLSLTFLLNYLIYLSPQKVLGEKTDVSLDKIAESINETRTNYGLETLRTDGRLNAAAEIKGKDILQQQYWGHRSPTGKMSWEYIKDTGYEYVEAGENLAKDFGSSRSLVSAWVDSPKHRENLLSNRFRDLGVAVVNGKLNGKETQVVVTLYATQRGQEVAGANSDNRVSQISGLILDKLGFYTNPVSPVLILFFAIIGLYSIFTFIVHINIKKSKQNKKLESAKKANIIKFASIFFLIIGSNLAVLYLT